ncbi:MAG: hypothetical protein WC861_03225 [Candidatus Micrarchaeia archaeon]|jgi:hypothetical protein
MRFASAIPLLFAACALLLAGCIGEPAKPGGAPLAGNGSVSGLASQEPPPPQPPGVPQPIEPEAGGKNGSAKAGAAAGSAEKPNYTNYCYPTYWRGVLNGTGRNDLEFDRCGSYNYSMEIQVAFTVPFDLAAYLAGKDFNFMDCPGVPEGAANGSRDISSGGRFSSSRGITSQVEKRVDRLPDMQTSSNGELHVSQPHGLSLSSYPRNDERNRAGYPHMVVDRCTWENGILVRGYDEAVLAGADAGGFALQGGMRSVSGLWSMDGALAGNYTLERVD